MSDPILRAHPVRFAAVLTAAVSLASCAAAPAAGAADAAWRESAVWDDGNAEFCAYEVEWRRYGTLFPGRALMILVKEPWAPELEVKADTPRPDGFDVLKLNHVRDVPTGIYTYHQMASVFLRRDTGALRKLAVTSSEGCGVSTAQLTGGELETRSYFDGQGARRQPWPGAALPEDGLAAVLRDYVAGEPPPTLALFPSLMAGRFPELASTDWTVSKRAVGGLELPAGGFDGVEIRLERGDRWLEYTFDRAAPHPLLGLVHSDGTRYQLAKCERIPYWTMNRPGGEAWLPPALR